MGEVYMPLMIGDWIKGTRQMSAEVKGVYIGLLLEQYDTGFIPSDLSKLEKIEPEIRKLWPQIKEKFVKIGPGKLQNKKLEEVRNFWNKQRQNGKKGGRPKNPNSNPNHNPDDNPNHNLHNDTDNDYTIPDINLKRGAGEKLLIDLNSEHMKQLLFDGPNLEALHTQCRGHTINADLLKIFNAHLVTEEKQHNRYSEYIKHLRNWIVTKPKTNNANITGNSQQQPDATGTRIGRTTVEALKKFADRRSSPGSK